ncbi:MAG: hypothetical protein H0X63_03110, partial [Flavobacteriales bacterium]|nr:hypothetical protein [Flavobacteriales bacterium]
MKAILFIFTLSLLNACNLKNEPNVMSDAAYFENTQNFKNDISVRTEKEVKPFNVLDPKTGMDLYTIWYPLNWEQIRNNNEWTFKGPNEVKISGEFGQFFTFGNSYGGYGASNRQPMNI